MIIDNKSYFTYIIIFIVVVFVFSKYNIKLNILLGFIVASIIIYFLIKKKINKQELKIKDNVEKKTLIDPTINGDYDDIINFVFYIQDLRPYTELNYIELVNQLNEFIEAYENGKDGKNVSLYYNLANRKRYNVLNAMHSMLFGFSETKIMMNKLKNGLNTINNILQKYLDELEDIYNEKIKNNGYTEETQIIDKGEKSYDYFLDKLYEIY